jgi:hypothetical protein
MPYSNKEKQQKYNEENREMINARQREYNKNNKEKIKEKRKLTYERKKKDDPTYLTKKNEKERSRYTQWVDNLTDDGKLKLQRRRLKSNWKRSGFKHTEDFLQSLTIIYQNTNHCELCNEVFTKNNKCADHHHSSGTFRNICCNICNNNRAKIDYNHLKVMMELHRYLIRLKTD